MDDERTAQLKRLIAARVVYTVPGMDAVDVRRDLTYKTVDDSPLGMDVYLPAGLEADERRGARAGQDHPATNQAIASFLAAALEHGVAVDFYNHPQGRHGFDVLDDDPRSREIVRRALAFVARHLGGGSG